MAETLIINYLKQVRRGKVNITQQTLADAVGCTRQTIVALESNKYNPSLALALKLAKELDTTVESLFRLKEIGDEDESD